MCIRIGGETAELRTLYISDLDGTLLEPKGEMTAATAEILNELIGHGMEFTFATARSIYSAVPITSAVRINVPCILMNGVSVYDISRKRYIKNEFLTAEQSAEIIQIFRDSGVHCFMYKMEEQTLVCCYTEITERVMQSFAEVRKKRYNKPFRQCAGLLDEADGRTVYFTVLDEQEKILPIKEAVEKISGVSFAFYEDTYTGKWYLEIFSSGASKANGIRFLREQYGYDEVICFGDNLNDLSMFEAADIRVAVGNARPELKAAADFTALPNTEDGAARWMRNHYESVNGR